MARWMIELVGRQADLDLLNSRPWPGEYGVTHTESGYYLIAEAFDTLNTAMAVWKAGHQILKRINGATKMVVVGFRPVRLGAVTEIDVVGPPRTTHVLFANDLVLPPPQIGSPTLNPTDEQQAESHDPIMSILEKADVYPELVPALELFAESESLDWVDLYRVYEFIEHDIGSEKKLKDKGWSDKIELFKRTANALARHAPVKFLPPENPMHLVEANELIRRLLRRWINEKNSDD